MRGIITAKRRSQHHDHLSDPAMPRDIACALGQDYFVEIARMIHVRCRAGSRRIIPFI
jgi:hypothetical protein